MYTVAEIREMIAPYVGDTGVCPDDVQVLRELNAARESLWSLGDWVGTVGWFCIKIDRDCLTIPAGYSQIRKAYVYAGRAVDLRDDPYFGLVDTGISTACGQCTTNRWVDLGKRFHTQFDWDCPSILQFRTETPGDAGVEIHLSGTDGNIGIREKVVLVSEASGLSSTIFNYVAPLGDVVKPRTKGAIYVYATNLSKTNCSKLVAVWQKWETNPLYRRYKAMGPCSDCAAVVKAKREFYPLVDETDIVDLKLDALILALQARVELRNRDAAKYATSIAAAGAVLRAELSDDEVWSGDYLKVNFAHNNSGLKDPNCGAHGCR